MTTDTHDALLVEPAVHLAAPEIFVDRSAETQHLVSAILKRRGRTLVLHGGHGTGKTDLMTHWVIPALRMNGGTSQIAYGDCRGGLPDELSGSEDMVPFREAVQSGCIIVLDNFESILDKPRDERRAALDRLFQCLHGSTGGATTVLVTDTRQLTSVYGLTSYDPAIGTDVLEIAAVGLAEGLEALSLKEPETAARCTPDLLSKLDQEAELLEREGWNVSFSLITTVDRHLRRLRKQYHSPSIGTTECPGLIQILEAHLDDALAEVELSHPGTGFVAEALLAAVVDPRPELGRSLLSELPARLGVSPDVVDTILAALARTGGLLQRSTGGAYELVVPQVERVIEQRLSHRREQLEPVHRIIDEGLRGARELGALLPSQRFEEIDRHRRDLILSDEQTRFLAECALRSGKDGRSATAKYWLARVSDHATRKRLLFQALADPFPEPRGRGAALLRDYPEPDVRDRLHRLALVDPDASARSEAIASLSAMRNDDLMSSLLREAESDDHPYQTQAVDALRIFRDEALPARLQTLVSRPVALPVREAAIKTLACLEIPQAVDALLEISLKDPDSEDERAATMALAEVTESSLNQRILDKLRLPGVSWTGWAVRIAVALVAFVVALPVNLAILDFEAGGLALWALVLTLPTGWLVRRLASRQLTPRSPAGIVGLGLFAFCAVTALFWFHGLGHLFTGRWRRGMLLFVAEAVGIVSVIAGGLAFPLNLWLGGFYLFTGAALVIGSYLVDVSGAFFDAAFASRREVGRRTVAIYRQIMANPAITAILFESLSANDPNRSRRARIVLRAYGPLIPPDHLIDLMVGATGSTAALAVRSLARSKTERTVEALEQRWNLDPSDQVRSRVARVLYLRPTKRSLESLHRLRREMSVVLKAKSSWAAWQSRLSDWPWYSKISVALMIPAMVVLVYHGGMVLRNQAWSTILMLKAPSWSWNAVTDVQKIKTVEYLADVHPADSREVLLEEFKKRHDNITDPLGTAIANGLLTIYSSQSGADSTEQRALRNELMGSVDAFANALAFGDSASAERSLHLLASLGEADDSALAAAGVGTLAAFIRTGPDAYRQHAALDALASLPFARSLPALDDLATDTTNAALLVAIRERMSRAVDTARVRAMRGTGNREHLLAVLREVKLPHPPPAVGRTIRELDLLIPRGCDLNLDEACDSQDTALEDVAREPAAEHGYRDLFDQYVIAQRYQEAKTEFERLKDLHPTSIWPRKVLAELYHEYLAPTDSTAFQSSYDEMVGLRGLGAYRELRADSNTYDRIEADFAEVALTAGHYDVMNTVSRQLVRPGSRDVYKLNMALFDYIAEVAQRNTSRAEASLQRLRIVVDSLPADFYNGWIYPGTVAFIKLQKLPRPLERAVLALCRERNWYDHAEAVRILADNQAALKHLE